MKYQDATFAVEIVDGYRLGRLWVPLPQIANWLNFLATPHYQADIVSAEQDSRYLSIYFEASEGVYAYLESRLNSPCQFAAPAA